MWKHDRGSWKYNVSPSQIQVNGNEYVSLEWNSLQAEQYELSLLGNRIYLNKHSEEDFLWLSPRFLLPRKFHLKYILPYYHLLLLPNSALGNHEDFHVFFPPLWFSNFEDLFDGTDQKNHYSNIEMGFQDLVSLRDFPKGHPHPQRLCQTIPWISSWVPVWCADFQDTTTTKFGKGSQLGIPGGEWEKKKSLRVPLFPYPALF